MQKQIMKRAMEQFNVLAIQMSCKCKNVFIPNNALMLVLCVFLLFFHSLVWWLYPFRDHREVAGIYKATTLNHSAANHRALCELLEVQDTAQGHLCSVLKASWQLPRLPELLPNCVCNQGLHPEQNILINGNNK